MNKGIILFQSKYGATAKYAEWLREDTHFDIVETKKADINKVRGYDTIVLCGGVYASGILGLSFLKKNIDFLQGKKIAVFCAGASPYNEEAIEQVRKLHFKDKMSGIPLFYGRGAWNFDSMSFTDRTLCKMLQKAVAKKNPAEYEPWEAALMEAGEQACDWTAENYLYPLYDFLKAE